MSKNGQYKGHARGSLDKINKRAPLAGRVALVIGCTGVGIPRAVVLDLVRAGARIVGLDLPGTEKRGLGLVKKVQSVGGQILFHTADASNLDQVRNIVKSARDLGPISSLICLAGKAEKGDHNLLDARDPVSMLRDSVRNNTETVVVAAYCALPYMLADGGGTLVTFDSVNSIAPLAQWAYTCGKAPLKNLVRDIAAAYGHHGLRTYNLILGTVPSKKQSWLDRFALYGDDLLKSIALLYALGTVGRPADVAKVVVDLCTKKYWMSGCDIPLHGGWTGVPLNMGDWHEVVFRLRQSGIFDGLIAGRSPLRNSVSTGQPEVGANGKKSTIRVSGGRRSGRR